MSVAASERRAAFVVEAGDGRPIYVLGGEILVKISSRDTAGAFTVFEGRTQPLEGPPLHRHAHQDEWWHILEGDYKFEVDGQVIYARPGDVVFAPRGSRHTFQVIGRTPGRTLTTAVPGGLDEFFEDIEKAAPRGSAPDVATLQPLFDKHGQELLGPPLAARPLADLQP